MQEPVRVYRILSYPGAAEPEKVVSPAEKDALSLSEQPSIAVLPFNNMSGDPEQEYFDLCG